MKIVMNEFHLNRSVIEEEDQSVTFGGPSSPSGCSSTCYCTLTDRTRGGYSIQLNNQHTDSVRSSRTLLLLSVNVVTIINFFCCCCSAIATTAKVCAHMTWTNSKSATAPWLCVMSGNTIASSSYWMNWAPHQQQRKSGAFGGRFVCSTIYKPLTAINRHQCTTWLRQIRIWIGSFKFYFHLGLFQHKWSNMRLLVRTIRKRSRGKGLSKNILWQF